ncbi:hypothetical protein CYMTET_17581, partial [Cymbomonas tetramitiformis]
LQGGMDEDGLASDALYAFDVEKKWWMHITISGKPPEDRSGHAGAILGSKWFLVGGGDSRKAIRETAALDLLNVHAGHLKWEIVTDAEYKLWQTGDAGQSMVVDPPTSETGRSPLASEELTMCSVPCERGGCLVAFGGTDGKAWDKVMVLRPSSLEHVNTMAHAKASAYGMNMKSYSEKKEKELDVRDAVQANINETMKMIHDASN